MLTLQTAFDTTIALVWYYTDTKRGHFYYHKYFQKMHDTKQKVGFLFGFCDKSVFV